MIVSKENIELRSEKVRNLIGQVPPFIIRSGIIVIAIIVITLILCSYFLKYPYIVNAEATLIPTKNNVLCKLQIPADQYYKVGKGQSISLRLTKVKGIGNEMIRAKIDSISDKILIQGNYALNYCFVTFQDSLLTITGKKVVFNEPVGALVEIETADISVIERIIKPIRQLLKKK